MVQILNVTKIQRHSGPIVFGMAVLSFHGNGLLRDLAYNILFGTHFKVKLEKLAPYKKF